MSRDKPCPGPCFLWRMHGPPECIVRKLDDRASAIVYKQSVVVVVVVENHGVWVCVCVFWDTKTPNHFDSLTFRLTFEVGRASVKDWGQSHRSETAFWWRVNKLLKGAQMLWFTRSVAAWSRWSPWIRLIMGIETTHYSQRWKISENMKTMFLFCSERHTQREAAILQDDWSSGQTLCGNCGTWSADDMIGWGICQSSKGAGLALKDNKGHVMHTAQSNTITVCTNLRSYH